MAVMSALDIEASLAPDVEMIAMLKSLAYLKDADILKVTTLQPSATHDASLKCGRDRVIGPGGKRLTNSTDTPKAAISDSVAVLLILLCVHDATLFSSVAYSAGSFSNVINYQPSTATAMIFGVSLFTLVSAVFAVANFSVGFFLGFYFFTMILGYLWFERFSFLSYNHHLAVASIILSGAAFFLPSLLVRSPVRQVLQWPAPSFDLMIHGLFLLAAAILVAGAAYHFKLVGLSEMYEFREEIQYPLVIRYGAGIITVALLPVAFACWAMSKRYWKAAAALLIMVAFYPVTLTKLTLLAPFWLLFLAALSAVVAGRTAVILSLLLPMSAGIAALTLARWGMIPLDAGRMYFGNINVRMIAMPSMALEVYNNYFASHPLTHFCQINLLKTLMSCPYHEQLSVLMRGYNLGAFNASLFATEGIASVGLWFAPLSALGCGLIIALGNRLSAGLPARFILVSGGMLPVVLLNVPLSTNLLTNGVAVLFLLWYVTPRSIFGKETLDTTSPKPSSIATLN
ncbi:hypothetical protein JQ615_34510 [Bradyrhizobium jicamae]|uniref:Uncharacterized protein n=1 Tax=Bradyrhizobium jicamae TaxID=280332 RepID=A0ABS5FUK1_9BRAD|nr:hypothetical protein [Bradyrhizobium jicamae]MBR0800492.1 hypothetical protein [Bradyrhizobium jicamae]